MSKKSQPNYKRYINITPEELGKTPRTDAGMQALRAALVSLRRGISARKGSFTRAGWYSYALGRYEDESLFGQEKRPKIESLSRNQLIMEIIKAQKFYSAETSTLAGAIKVQRDVERRLFGVDSSRHMTLEESRDYWSLYDEYKRLHADMYYRLGSDRLQRLLAEQVLQPGSPIGTESFALGDAIERAHEFLEDWEYEHT